jgi:uncharacterized protein YidB (DUF937 family)
MGFLDALMKQAMGGQTNASGLGGLVSTLSQNPQILSALGGLLSTRDTSVGGSGGLAGLLDAFQQHGMSDMTSNWISTGPNPPLNASQVSQVLGQDTLGQFASKAGVPVSEAGSLLAGLLPEAIDFLTPNGSLPDTNSLEGSLGSLLSGLRR